MRIGYACINLSIRGTFRTCFKSTVESNDLDHILRLAIENLMRTRDILKWNVKYGMKLYRITSDLVPFGSHPLLEGWDWWNHDVLQKICYDIRKIVEEEDLRISVHPGQYNNLGSPHPAVVSNTIRDLEYQMRLLELVGGTDMILHLGGVYGNKKETILRFKNKFRELPDNIRNVLRIENDDKSYTIEDVFEVCSDIGTLPLFDYHHNICNPSINIQEIKHELFKFWEGRRVKIHLSSGRSGRRDISHSDYISKETVEEFTRDFDLRGIDLMLETKKKDLAVFRFLEELNEIGNRM